MLTKGFAVNYQTQKADAGKLKRDKPFLNKCGRVRTERERERE